MRYMRPSEASAIYSSGMSVKFAIMAIAVCKRAERNDLFTFGLARTQCKRGGKPMATTLVLMMISSQSLTNNIYTY